MGNKPKIHTYGSLDTPWNTLDSESGVVRSWPKIHTAPWDTDEGNAVLIRPEGTGDYGSAEGHGNPVLVEFVNGTPRVFVWADINQEDPTHMIDLSGALESNRTEEDN